MTSYKKRVPTPLTPAELKEKLKSSEIQMPVLSDGEVAQVPSGPKKEWRRNAADGKVPFRHVDIRSISNTLDMTFVDGNGKEYEHPGGMRVDFNWGVDGFGFGEVTFKRLTDGTILIDAEGLGKKFVKGMLCAMVDKAKMKHPFEE